MSDDVSNKTTPHFVFANDNREECELFKDGLDALHISSNISVIQNGSLLLNSLKAHTIKPDYIFINLEKPCSANSDCQKLIKEIRKLQSVPIVIFSKSGDTHNRDYCYDTRPYEYYLRALSFLL